MAAPVSVDLGTFEREIAERGFAFFPDCVPEPLLKELREALPGCEERCRQVREANGMRDGMQGVAHHVVTARGPFLRLLEDALPHAAIERYFGGPYILNSFGSVDNRRETEQSYQHGLRFHRDVRTYSGDFRLMLNVLVALDAFTEEKGATRLVPGSHRAAERPAEAQLEACAVPAIAAAGSVLLFDSNLWHAAGRNRTDAPRRALTLTFTRPFVKQQLDYPRLLGNDFPASARLRQVLGYDARVPASLEEWYQPPERRMYKPGQG